MFRLKDLLRIFIFLVENTLLLKILIQNVILCKKLSDVAQTLQPVKNMKKFVKIFKTVI